MDRKKQIEQLYTDALYNDEAPNVFADRILSLFGVVVSGACKCDIPDPFKMMPYKCFRCHGKIEISETELCHSRKGKECIKPSSCKAFGCNKPM